MITDKKLVFIKSSKLFFILLTIIIFFFCTLSYAKSDALIVKISTGLGVETEVSIRNIILTDNVLSHIFSDYTTWKISIEVSQGVYFAIPFNLINDISSKDNFHIVRLKDNREIKGHLIGKIISDSDKEYSLKEVTSMTIIDTPSDATSLYNNSKKYNEWFLNIKGESELSYKVIKPFFAFQYYSSSGYIMGGSTRETTKQSCYLNLNDKEHLINIEDFVSLSLQSNESSKELNQLLVESGTGVKSKGLILHKEEDDAGFHEGYEGWFLTASMAENDKILIAVSNKEWRLYK